jgi:acyl-[acyl-carrier-protein]-phospholipid O-acyltransferase/long-chain-fatty-acid--[acyl-carrier-protein] ligase
MVPHLTLEQEIAVALDLTVSADAGPPLAVVGIPDEKKGESLVLLTVQPIHLGDLRKILLEKGRSSLWIPKVVKIVPAVPILASGKLDLRECLRLAREAGAAVESPVTP